MAMSRKDLINDVLAHTKKTKTDGLTYDTLREVYGKFINPPLVYDPKADLARAFSKGAVASIDKAFVDMFSAQIAQQMTARLTPMTARSSASQDIIRYVATRFEEAGISGGGVRVDMEARPDLVMTDTLKIVVPQDYGSRSVWTFSVEWADTHKERMAFIKAACDTVIKQITGSVPGSTPSATVPDGEFQEPTPEASEKVGWFMGETKRVLTPQFRVSFPKVFKAEAFQEGQEPKYSIVMLFPKKMDAAEAAKFEAMKRVAAETAKAKWGDKIPKNLRSPFRDGAEKDLPGYEDVVFVSASSKQKPGLVNEDAEPILSPEDFYPGCFAHAYVTCYAYDMAGNRGVAFGLSTVQKIKDGEPFTPRNNAQDDFAPVAGNSVAQAPADIDNIFGS